MRDGWLGYATALYGEQCLILAIYVSYSSTQIPRNESNFVWGSHRLLVEMHNNQYWFWNAPEDHHGTTMNSLALKYPKKYKNFMKTDGYKHWAQWTRVSVLPSAVVSAAGRA